MTVAARSARLTGADATDATGRRKPSMPPRWPLRGRRRGLRDPRCTGCCAASTPTPASFGRRRKRSMKTIKTDYLARVEGEGGVRIRFRGDQVRDVQVRIFEPPRFFEAFLRGRCYAEVPDITARICGICPVAYQMSGCAAMEDALEVRVTPALADLRRILYCGEWRSEE